MTAIVARFRDCSSLSQSNGAVAGTPSFYWFTFLFVFRHLASVLYCKSVRAVRADLSGPFSIWSIPYKQKN